MPPNTESSIDLRSTLPSDRNVKSLLSLPCRITGNCGAGLISFASSAFNGSSATRTLLDCSFGCAATSPSEGLTGRSAYSTSFSSVGALLSNSAIASSKLPPCFTAFTIPWAREAVSRSLASSCVRCGSVGSLYLEHDVAWLPVFPHSVHLRFRFLPASSVILY